MGKEDGVSLMKAAKKAHSKSITKWSISNDDWQQASQDYEKAARCFMREENVAMTIEAWRASSNAHDKAGNGFFAGKALENLAGFLIDCPTPKDEKEADARGAEITKCYIDAAMIFAYANKPDRQAEALAKAARYTGVKHAPEAAKLMRTALDSLEESEKYHLTLDLYRALLLTQVRGELWTDAITTLKRQNNAFKMIEQPGNAPKCGLEIVIIALFTGDWVLADREFKEATNSMYAFAHSKEQSVAYDLISAVEDRDDARLSDAVKEQTISFMTPDIARMAKKIRISGCGNAPKKKEAPAVGSGSAPAAAAAPAARDDDESEEDSDEDVR